MALIWQSTGFWLLVSTVLLLIVGCTVLRHYLSQSQVTNPHNLTLIPTNFPTLTPLGNLELPLIINTLSLTSNPIYEQSNASPPNTEIYIESPTCYSLASGQYSCLGKIWNYSENSIGDTSVQVSVFDRVGAKIDEQTATSEQRITESGSFAPYRTIVDAQNINETSFSTALMQVLPPSPNIQTLNISAARASITESGRYRLSVTLHNNSGYEAQDIRLFTTLENDEWEIVGYNVHEVENILQNGDMQRIELEIIPHAMPDVIQHILHVEAIINE